MNRTQETKHNQAANKQLKSENEKLLKDNGRLKEKIYFLEMEV